jgi:hypothetical protein
VLLSQTRSNNNNQNPDEKVEDCRRKLFQCPSWLLDSWWHWLLLESRLYNLSNALYDRFQQLGGIEYLEESIAYYRQLEWFNRCPIGDRNRSTSLNRLGNALTTRFEQLGGIEDLEEAITCHRQALALRPHGHPDRSSSLNNLANAVSTRFQHLGGMEDLEEVITCHRQALALLPHGHPNCSSTLNNLALALSTRFEQLRGMEDLEEAITCHRQALVHSPTSSTCSPISWPSFVSSLNNLASAVSTRFQQLGGIEDLEEAITCHRQSLALNPNRSLSLNNLASTTRFQQLGSFNTCLSITLRPDGHPGNALCLLAFSSWEE